MSSYIISKQEYMKAAGLVTGLSEELRHFWLYDYETRRNSTAEDYKRKFTECYEMNVISVKEQYHGDEVGADARDQNEYKQDFETYRKLGKQLCYNDGQPLINAIHELNAFFGSCLYQTEYDPYMFKMQMFFNQIITELFKTSSHYETQSWSTLEIEKPDHEYSRIL